MSDHDEACERLIDTLEEAVYALERGKEECVSDDWELFPPEEIEEIIEMISKIIEKLER